MVTELLVPRRGIVVPKPPSYLKLDMAFAIGAGTQLMDKSRYRSHGTISGASWADGAHGRCLDFNPATPSYVEIPAAYDQLDFTSQDVSVIFRVKLDTLITIFSIITRGQINVDGWDIIIHNVGMFGLRTSQVGTNQSTYTGAGSVTTATWYTGGFSRSGSSVYPYMDGILVNPAPAGHINPVTSVRTAKIGIYDDKAGQALDGKMEFLRIFGGIALSASEHLAYHNALK